MINDPVWEKAVWEPLLPSGIWTELELLLDTRRGTPPEMCTIRRRISLSLVSENDSYNSYFWKNGKKGFLKTQFGRPQQWALDAWLKHLPSTAAETWTFIHHRLCCTKTHTLRWVLWILPSIPRMGGEFFYLTGLLFSTLSFNGDSETGASFSSSSRPKEIRIIATKKRKQIRPQQQCY